MKYLKGRFIARTSLLFVVFPVFLLFGCNPTSEGKAAQPPSAQAIADGNADHGRDLFMGYVHFQNDGPPCMGCHSVGNNGILGGGIMGPNLTNVSTRRDDTEILGVLSNTGLITSPVMGPIYTDFPLTADEQADLLAFMKASVGQPESNKEWVVFGISIAGFLGAVGVLGFVYRNRLRSVRRVLVNKAQKESL